MSSNAPPVVLKEGFLAKRSRNPWPVARFQRRYFRLFPGELQYFYTPLERTPRRRVQLRLDTRVTPTNDQGYERCFVVKTSPTENFYVQAEREDEKEDWVTAIYNALRRTEDVAEPRGEDPPLSPSRPTPPPVPLQPPARILLHLNVVEATGLKGVNYLANAKSDPFCVVNFVGKDGALIRTEEVRTKYVTDTVEPVWNEHFTLGHAVDLASVEAIHVELQDHEVMGNPKPLGFVKVPLSMFQMSPASTGQSELVDRSFRIEPPPDKPTVMDYVTGGSSSPRNQRKEQETMIRDHGKLHLVMSIAGPNLVHFFRGLQHTIAPQNRIVTDGVDHTDNRLEVTVLCAKDLIAADFNKSSDPFVELTLLDTRAKPIRGEIHRTTIKEKTRNPAWQDEHHIFGRINRIDEASQLLVRVLDWDEHSKNDPLGRVVVSLAGVSTNTHTEWYALQPEENMAVRENLGSIQLKISLAGETLGERNRRLQIEKEVASKTHELSVEQLELENAQHQLHEAACSLDGARIACAVNDYQAREPQFYGLNGCIHHLNAQLPRAHSETTSSDEGFQSRTGIEGQALLEVSVVGTHDLKKAGTTIAATNPYALIEIDPSVCIEECKRISAPQSPQRSKRVEAGVAATEARSGLFARRAQGEVSSHRAKLGKNEVRSERHLDMPSNQPMLKVEIKSGHGLTGVDFGGYSDPYCTLSLTDRTTGKSVESEKKRTAVIQKTLNPVWGNEVFILGHNFPLERAGSLLIHVKDHNMTRSTPLGRVQIPLSDLCHASATTTSISSTAKERRYALMPEPWMKRHAQHLGELCIKTEVIGDATLLAEMLQRFSAADSPGKMLSFLSIQSFASDAHLSDDTSSMALSGYIGDEDETVETIDKGKQIRTSTAAGTSASWRKEKFSLLLSYPGLFSGYRRDLSNGYVLHLRIHSARSLLGSGEQFRRNRGEKEAHHRNHLLGRRAKTSAYFTVIPVHREGQLEHQERKQSLTVYGTCNPNWPDKEFVFDKLKNLQSVSYLSLHVYSRDLENEVTKPIAQLLSDDEREQRIRLKRFQIRKIGSTGLVDDEDDGHEVLPFGQRVLAYRKCGNGNGGRFFPATVQKYRSFPVDDYEVLFEDGIETIDDLWDMLSSDVKGKIEAIHSDGSVDVSILSASSEQGKADYARNVSPSLLTPVDAFTASIESVMARHMNEEEECKQSWLKLKHSLSGFTLDVLAVTGLPKYVSKPRCKITFIGNPHVVPTRALWTIAKSGQLKLKDGISLGGLSQSGDGVASFELNFDHALVDADQKRFEKKLLILGSANDDGQGNESSMTLADEKAFLMHTGSVLIEVLAEDGVGAVGSARVDLVTLSNGAHDIQLRLVPPEHVEYFKHVGSLNLHLECVGLPREESKQYERPSAERGVNQWSLNRTAAEDVTFSLLETKVSTKLTRIGRRQLLRSSLTPTENAQIDAFHTVLVVVMKRVVSILREIQLFEDFETLATEEFPKFHHVHTVNADTKSGWLGRPINEMPLEVRKTVVEELELELLDIGASQWQRPLPRSGPISREEWVQLRSVRQQALQKVSGFFMQDRVNAVMVHVPCCFTGEGMVRWICSRPEILWADKWVKYCNDERTKTSCRLHWDVEQFDPDAMDAPKTPDQVLLWLNALGDAGYVENVCASLSSGDANKKYYLVEGKPDRLYRLREIELWVRKQPRDKSLFPLDLVRELDCVQQLDLVHVKQPPSSPSASPKKGKKASSPKSTSSEDVARVTESDLVNAQKRTYAKKLVDHVEGFLGLQNVFSTILFSREVQANSLLKPAVAKTQQYVAETLLWDWKYCIFIPGNKMLYVYESEVATAPTIILDMNSTMCHAAYNFAYEAKGGWFNVVGATVLHAAAAADGSTKLSPIGDELRDRLMKVTADGSLVFEFKTSDAQLWVQSFVRANVHVDMKPHQLVVLKRLNPTVLQSKCVDNVANFNPQDLEGSFQGMLNKFFKHDLVSSHQEHEQKMRNLRAKTRSEMKKAGLVGEAVMAYFGKGQRFNPGPTNEREYTRGALYSASIVRIRTPFADAKYRFSHTYDIKEAPTAMQALLRQYKVVDKESWLKVPKATRDIFLLYDVEYRHAHEIIHEEGMLREHVRTHDGDLDPFKVEERCTDINVWFKPSDLEDCVTRIVMHTGVQKPLGCVKIPIKTVSAHRVMDVWYPLAPEKDMINKANLGQIRVQLRLTPTNHILRSSKVPAHLLEEVKEAAAVTAAAKPLAVAVAAASSPLKMLKDKVYKSLRMPISPTAAGASAMSRERSFVTIRIIEGRKMIAADVRTSDPYVKIVLIREKDDREETTKLKTDIKYSTLSPKWTNQEFVLGKTPDTLLSDKKAILLRVMDHDLTSTDDPMGCVKIELQRDKSGYVSGLVLVHADEKGLPTSRALHLNNKMQVEVDEKLLADEKAGMSKTDAARGNNPAVDGKLGRLRFVIEVAQNENFVDPNGVSAAQMTTLMRGLETQFSYEVEFKSIAPERNASSISFEDLRQCSCVFIPKGDGGQRINYDLHTEDLGRNNSFKLGELLASMSTGSGHPKILGRTFDMSKVMYFDVEVQHPTNGRIFNGRFGERLNLRNPRKHKSMLHEVVMLTDKDNKDVQLKLTIGVSLVAIHRAQRLKRLLAETFRMVGLDFDVRRINDESKGSARTAGNSMHELLWGVCKAHFVPGRHTTQVLLAQVHRMCLSARLHWKFTPQLLAMVLEHVFLFGEKDRLSYDDAVALDEILSRWSLVLQHLNEAKTQLVGHLHGMETPRLIHTLMGECDWTGFELVSVPNEALNSTTASNSMNTQQSDALEETILRPGTKVHALLVNQRKHAGIPVDVMLSTGDYVAGTITVEHGHDIFDVAFCTNAKVQEEGDAYFSDDDELPPLSIGQAVFMCPIAHSAKDAAHSAGKCVSGKVGRVVAMDTELHPEEPYGIVLDGEDEARQVWAPRVWLDTTFHRVFGDVLHPQLVKDDFVRVFQATSTEDNRGAGLLARILRNHRNGKYDVEYVDKMDVKKAHERGASGEPSACNAAETSIEVNVPRKRLAPVSDKEIWEAQIVRAYLAPSLAVLPGASGKLVVTYDLSLENGDSIEGVTRDQLRPAHEVFPSDKCVLASIFSPSFEIQDKDQVDTYVTKRLQELYAHDELVKVYVMLPAKVKEVSVRDRCSTKALQVKIDRRDPSKPRFVEQCHGYATMFTDVEKAKLEQIFDTAVVLRGDTARSNHLDAFDIEKCFCLYMAPQPRVEIHGALCITPDKSSKASKTLFETLRDMVSNCKPRLLAVFQQMIRNTVSVHMPLDRKGRVVFMKDAFSLGNQLTVVFEVGIAPKNMGSLAYAVDVAYQDAARIFERLGKLKSLLAYGDDLKSVEEITWMLDIETPSDTHSTALVVQALGRRGEDNSKPSLTLEMLPLDDQRLSVKDDQGKVWELCLPMDRILVEAQLRRHLVPFYEAKVVSVSTKQELLQTHLHQPQVNKRRRRDSTLQNKPTEPLKLKKRFSTGRQLQVRFLDNATADVAEHDTKFDSLHVLVKQASELTLDERVGHSDLDVDVMLVSRDFRPNAEGDQALKTPFGEILFETGEIRRDYAGNQYPQRSTQRLTKDRSSTGWIALDAAAPLTFGYPGVDLERVSHVRVRIWAKNRTILVGSSDIPIADIPVTGYEQASNANKSTGVQVSLLTKWTRSKLADRDSLSSSSCEQTVSLCKKEHNQDNSVGKITLHMERVRGAKGGDVVLAKRFLKEADAWKVSEYELLALTLKQHDDHLMRGLLATSSIVPHGGRKLLLDLVEQELQLQKIADVMMIAHAMELIYATKSTAGQPASQTLALRDGTVPLSSTRMVDQMRLAIDQTKWFIEDTAAELGIRTSGKRLPWSAEAPKEERHSEKGEYVVMQANVSNTSIRVRRTMLKLYQMYRNQLIPTLQRLYEADAVGDAIDVQKGEELLKFFEEEVEDLDCEDQHVFRRVYQRIRLIKIAKVLQDIMHTSLIVTVMNYDHAMGDDEIGTAYVPLIDLLDRVEHDNGYDLMKKRRSAAGRGAGRPGSPQSIVQFASTTSQGKVRLKIKLSYSESSLLEQATRVFKIMKDKFVAQHELARRRINAAVVPAQRRRWMTIKGYLEELKDQARGKLHWERTPVLLSLVWDIFLTPDHARRKRLDEDEEKHLEGLVEKANEYRSAVVDVHKRWANLQPLLEELLQVQGATQIHARRTPELLDLVDREVEGLDLVLSTAYQQVRAKWIELRDALEELVRMKERRKIHMARAPQLLTKVTQRCSKGLNDRYADAVSEVQFRWMAITKSDGPLNELRLTEKKGLHWRRTHELVLLLNEQCEGFAEVDAKTLDIVQKRWEQVQEWLNDVVQMQVQHTIDCEVTPFILKKMHLVESRNKAAAGATAKHAVAMKKRMQAAPASPRSRLPTRTDDRRPPPSPRGYSTISIASSGSSTTAELVDADVDVDRLEGLVEWYAIEESKRELERIPFHRITTDYDRNNRLKYSQDGKDTRLFITQEEMAFTPRNVRAALVDRGVIPIIAPISESATHTAAPPTTLGATATISKNLLDEIHLLEQSIESMYADGGSLRARYVKWNPERVAELYVTIENLGKSDLLWKIDHAVNTNHEIEVPGNVNKLLIEMKLRAIQTSEIDNLIRTLLVTLQKEELAKMGVDVPPTANFAAVLSLMHRHQVKDVVLPVDIAEIQTLLQHYGMDKKGEPVFLRGMRIGTQMWSPDDGPGGGAHTSVQGKAVVTKINTGLGIIDAKIEQLRKTLLMEALRKRNSLIKTFPVESFILTEEELAECTEVDMSGDYMTLIEAFQQLLIHESYTKRLAEYAAMDRCMRALVSVSADKIVTKEDIATKLQTLGSSRFRLPLEAFTQEELLEAASTGKIRTPTEEMLARCPVGHNAKAMAYYAAMSHAALVFQEIVRFRLRLDPMTNTFVDALPFERASSADGLSVPKNRSRMSFKEYVVDWLLGSEDSVVKLQRRLGAYHRQRLEWASAAFTLRNRWYQRGFGWCDDATRCAGVKVLLQRLLLFEAANKMHMIDTESLLSEVNDKCVNLRPREREAKEHLEQRYITNLERLETLVIHAEKCMNNRKIHTEEAPALLHAIEQACVVPHGLHALHKQAYHVVSTHWTRHRARLSELVHMQKQGTFSIERTPELLSAMEFHTEGLAGADELTMEKVIATASASSTPVEMQQRYVDKKVDEIRRGQRKQNSSLRLNLDDAHTEKDVVAEELKEDGGEVTQQWESLSPSKRDVRPLSPRDKQTSWKVVTTATAGGAVPSPTKPSIVIEDKYAMFEQRRKSSIGDELRELLKSPSKWLIASTEPEEVIRPEVFFPREVTIDLSHSSAASEPTLPQASAPEHD